MDHIMKVHVHVSWRSSITLILCLSVLEQCAATINDDIILPDFTGLNQIPHHLQEVYLEDGAYKLFMTMDKVCGNFRYADIKEAHLELWKIIQEEMIIRCYDLGMELELLNYDIDKGKSSEYDKIPILRKQQTNTLLFLEVVFQNWILIKAKLYKFQENLFDTFKKRSLSERTKRIYSDHTGSPSARDIKGFKGAHQSHKELQKLVKKVEWNHDYVHRALSRSKPVEKNASDVSTGRKRTEADVIETKVTDNILLPPQDSASRKKAQGKSSKPIDCDKWIQVRKKENLQKGDKVKAVKGSRKRLRKNYREGDRGEVVEIGTPNLWWGHNEQVKIRWDNGKTAWTDPARLKYQRRTIKE